MEESPEFPAVTVCNMNPVRRSLATGTLATFSSRSYSVAPETDYATWYDATAPPAPTPTPPPATTGTKNGSWLKLREPDL